MPSQGLPLDVRLQFATAPVSWQSSVCADALLRYARAFASGGEVKVRCCAGRCAHIPDASGIRSCHPHCAPRAPRQVGISMPTPVPGKGRDAILARLSALEETHQALGLYLW